MRWRAYEMYMRNLLAQQLEIPLVGKIFFAVPAASSTSGYSDWIRREMDVPSELISEGNTAINLAYANMTANQNDVLLVAPGLYTETVSIDWAKSHTHIVGMGGPNIDGRVAKYNTMLYLDTASIDYALDVSGEECQFRNFQIQSGVLSGSANATTLSAARVTGYGNRFSKVMFKGIHSAAQLAAVACSSLEIGGDASYSRFEDCVIGQNGWGGVRTIAYQGHLIFTSAVTPSPQNGTFKHCLFLDRSDTTGLATVVIKTYGGLDRLWLFEDCHFDNWSTNYAGTMAQVFVNAVMMQAANIRLKNCSASGYGAWSPTLHGGKYVMSDMPITGTGGGLVRAATGAAGA